MPIGKMHKQHEGPNPAFAGTLKLFFCSVVPHQYAQFGRHGRLFYYGDDSGG